MNPIFQPKIDSKKIISKNNFSSDPFFGLRLIIDINKNIKKFRVIETMTEDTKGLNYITCHTKYKTFNNVILKIKTDIKTFIHKYKRNAVKLECRKNNSQRNFSTDYFFYLFLFKKNKINAIQYDSEFVYLTLPYFEGIGYDSGDIIIQTDYNIEAISYDIVEPLPNNGYITYLNGKEKMSTDSNCFWRNPSYHRFSLGYNNYKIKNFNDNYQFGYFKLRNEYDNWYKNHLIGFYIEGEEEVLDNIQHLVIGANGGDIYKNSFSYRLGEWKYKNIIRFEKYEVISLCPENTFLGQCNLIHVKPVFKKPYDTRNRIAYENLNCHGIYLCIDKNDLWDEVYTEFSFYISDKLKTLDEMIIEHNIKLPYHKDFEMTENKINGGTHFNLM